MPNSIYSKITPSVYILADPLEPENYRYVGKTVTTARSRLSRHITEAQSSNNNSHHFRWIRKLLREGRKPIIVHTHACLDDNAAKKREIHYIALMKYAGYKLTNATNGGDGMSGYVHSQETCQIIRAKRLGTKASHESRKNRSIASIGAANPMYGKTQSAQTKSKIRARAIGRPAHNKGTKHKPDTIEKLRGPKSEGHKANLRQANIASGARRKGLPSGRKGKRLVLDVSTGKRYWWKPLDPASLTSKLKVECSV